MEIVMANGFCELSKTNLMELDGGVDWSELGSGLVDFAIGTVEGLAGAAAIVAGPDPLVKLGGLGALYDGFRRGLGGCKTVVDSFSN